MTVEVSYIFQYIITMQQYVQNDIQLEVSLREKLNKFTSAVNSCDFSNNGDYLVVAGR